MHEASINGKYAQYQLPWRAWQGLHNRNSGMLIYRFLSGDDDSSFCHKVTKALSEGWQLHGSPSYGFDQEAKKMRCGQAVTKTVADQPYDPDKKLTEYQ